MIDFISAPLWKDTFETQKKN